MTDDRELLVHMAGYATIAAVLGTANWASFTAVLFVAPIVLAALGFAGYLAAQWIISEARKTVPDPDSAVDGEPIATDGGREQ